MMPTIRPPRNPINTYPMKLLSGSQPIPVGSKFKEKFENMTPNKMPSMHIIITKRNLGNCFEKSIQLI